MSPARCPAGRTHSEDLVQPRSSTSRGHAIQRKGKPASRWTPAWTQLQIFLIRFILRWLENSDLGDTLAKPALDNPQDGEQGCGVEEAVRKNNSEYGDETTCRRDDKGGVYPSQRHGEHVRRFANVSWRLTQEVREPTDDEAVRD